MSSLNRKITTNKTKHLLVENELNKLKTFGSSYFISKSHFEEDGTQNYLVFQPIIRYFKVNTISNTFDTIYFIIFHHGNLKNYLLKVLNRLRRLIIVLLQKLDYYGTKTRVKFDGSCLQQPKVSYTHSNRVNIYIVYELCASTSNDNDPTLKNCLFDAVTLTKNVDIDKYGYSGYGIGFDRRSSFSYPNGGFCQNVMIFGVDMSSSAYDNNKKKYILIIGK